MRLVCLRRRDENRLKIFGNEYEKVEKQKLVYPAEIVVYGIEVNMTVKTDCLFDIYKKKERRAGETSMLQDKHRCFI